MTIADVRDFYVRRDAAVATGGEPLCTGCDKQLGAGENYSNYDLTDPVRAPRAFPISMVLCAACTYMVIAYRPPAQPL
jgi:hypothetical protein